MTDLLAAGDAVSWTALGVSIPAVALLVAGAVAWGKLTAKVNNGLSSDVKEIKSDVKEGFKSVWARLDSLPCRTPHCPSEDKGD